MKAAHLVGPKHFEIIDAEIPEVRDGNCLVKLERWSICGSDMRYEYGTVFPEEHYPVDVGAPCHELAGTIVESRSNDWREGQRVIIIPSTHQGLVEYYESLPDRIIALPDDGDVGEWLMCQPSGTVLFALQQLGTLLGRTVLVIGQGAIGQSFTAMAARAGARRVIAADLFDYRLEHSARLGATPRSTPPPICSTRPSRRSPAASSPMSPSRPPDIPTPSAAACRLVKRGGSIIMFGGHQNTGDPNPTLPIEARDLLYRNVTLISTASSARRQRYQAHRDHGRSSTTRVVGPR